MEKYTMFKDWNNQYNENQYNSKAIIDSAQNLSN